MGVDFCDRQSTCGLEFPEEKSRFRFLSIHRFDAKPIATFSCDALDKSFGLADI